MDDALEKSLSMGDMRLQRSLWLQNIRQNLDVIAKHRDVTPLNWLFADLPGIVIGAGPSLEKNVGLIAEHAKEYPLFCADRAFGKVCAAGAIPQFTVVVDWQDEVADFFKGEPVDKTILLASIKVSPKVLALPWKKIFFFLVMDSDKQFEEAEVNLTGGRVMGMPGAIICGNTAYLLARWAGCNPVTFCGCDMSMKEPSPGEMNYEAKDINGDVIYSVPGYLAGFDWLMRYLKLDNDVVSGKVKLYNSTEGGIMYSGELPALGLSDFMSRHPGARSSLNTRIMKTLC